MAYEKLEPCPFCGGVVRFDKAYSYFRDSVIYCDGCDMVFTLDDCAASDDDIVRAWNRRADDGVMFARCKVHNLCVSGKNIGWCPTEDDFCSLGERRTDNENR